MPVGPTVIRAVFEPLGVRPARLRQDRILDEARHIADPVHLVRVFGITEITAIYYVHAAHPGAAVGHPQVAARTRLLPHVKARPAR
jgi:hypothetical protein